MSRRMWILLVGGALAIGAVIAGSFIAIGQDRGDARTPVGAENRMRLEAVNNEVSCGSIAAVRIYLDDLVPRESGRTPGVSAGMVGFQATLQYDPEILRILAPSDIQLNSDLGKQDVDGDGLVRSFIVAANLKDHLGRAIIGAVSYVPGSQSLDDNVEEGVDPVAKGEPLLLMTVRFTPVGQGTTTVRNEGWDGRIARVEPQVFDAKGEFYEPLKVEDVEITVRGGDCPPPPPSPTTQPTSTPIVVPTRAPAATPAPLDGVLAPDAGRPDCRSDWNAYTDANDYFSVCYPADWSATVSPPEAYFGHTLSLVRADGTRFTIYWKETSAFEEGIIAERCVLVSHWRDVEEATIVIGDANITACVGDSTDYGHPNPDGPVRTRGTLAEVPVESGGAIVIFLTETGSGTLVGEDPLASVLRSLLKAELP